MNTPYGPTLNPDQFVPPFDEIVGELLQKGHALHQSLRDHMKPQWKDRSLKILIVDNANLDARTTVHAGSDYICIFRGAVETIYGNILGLLSVPAFLPAVGNITEGPLVTKLAQVLCSSSGLVNFRSIPASLGSCDVPAALLKPGDRLEVRFTMTHTGTASGFDFLLNWGNQTILSRHGGTQDTAIAAQVEAAGRETD